MVAAVLDVQCAAMASNVAQFKDKDFGQYGLGCVPDALVLSMSPEWEDKPSRDQGSVLERGRNFISTSGGSV
jgi:hypothetical protein